ncbi:MAG: putative Ig domain-containing protein [Synergistaceae bacterium]|nr:putative Ig domain-containing protein [Synergistaceae bacterium]
MFKKFIILCTALALALFSFSAAFADIAVNASNFPDANFREYILENLDDDGDGVLSNAEINAVVSMDVNACGIESLAGIKNFTSLQHLECYLNGMTELDVSNLNKLQVLYCSNNGLTSLNLSGCSSLRALNCRSNGLTELDLSSCTSLEWLQCSLNSLKTLDLAANYNLKNIYCRENELEAIDLSERENLLDVNCAGNNLIELDLYNCSSLQTLNCRNNALESLVLDGCVALKSLLCYGNQLRVIDLSSCGALEEAKLSTQIISGINSAASGNASYPYQVNLVNDYGLALDELKFIKDINTYDSRGDDVNSSFDYSSGVLFMEAQPSTITYYYEANVPETAPSGSAEMGVRISSSPVITIQELDEGYEGEYYKIYLKAAGRSVRWELTEGTLPNNLTLYSISGSLSGRLADGTAGTYKIKLRAYNTLGSDEKEFELKVNPASAVLRAPKIKTTNAKLPTGTLGASYSASLEADGTEPISWKLSSGALPDGLSLDSNGKITGTPRAKGSSAFEVTAENSEGSDTKTLRISVKEGDAKPKIITTSAVLPKGTVGEAYSASITAEGGTPITFKLIDGKLPKGLELSSAGAIYGMPTEEGSESFMVRASNSYGTDEKTLTIRVNPKSSNRSNDNNNNSSRKSSGGGGGGCTHGFGAAALALIFALAFKFKKI